MTPIPADDCGSRPSPAQIDPRIIRIKRGILKYLESVRTARPSLKALREFLAGQNHPAFQASGNELRAALTDLRRDGHVSHVEFGAALNPGEIHGLKNFSADRANDAGRAEAQAPSLFNLTEKHVNIMDNLRRGLWTGRIDSTDDPEVLQQIKELMEHGVLRASQQPGYVQLDPDIYFDQHGQPRVWIAEHPRADINAPQEDGLQARATSKPTRQITKVQYLIARLQAQKPLTLSQPTRQCLREVQETLKLPDLDAAVAVCAALGAALLEFIETNGSGSWITVVDAEQETQVRIVLQ